MPIQIAGLGVLSDDEYHAVSPKALHNLMLDLPNGGRLYMGETPDHEDRWFNPALRHVKPEDHAPSTYVTPERFDVRVDLYGGGLAAAEGVAEYVIRLGDSDIRKWEPVSMLDLADAVFFAFEGLANGERVLVNCQAGLNRSGLVTALVLIAYGFTPEKAIEHIRVNRAELCLVNQSFVNFLVTEGPRFAKNALKD